MKDFLIGKLGKEKGQEIYDLSQEKFKKLLSEAKPKSKQQQKIFEGMLLPRIALYKTLLENGFTEEEALDILGKNVTEVMAPDLKKKYASLDKLPFAFWAFKTGFTKIVAASDLWDADITKSKNEFTVTMKRCFWHDTYEEYGCPEACRFACECDDITYSDLKHISYFRTQTLGTGGSCCDFKFTKKK